MRILLAVCGSISFYKAFEILSHLKSRGVSVRIALSPGARQFVSPLGFSALAEAVMADDISWSPGAINNHIAFSRDCDAVLIAPASANTINKLACGIADDEFSSMLLAASDLPLLIAPAANPRMLAGITARSLESLKERGVVICQPVCKQLACGEFAAGALAEPGQIAASAINLAAQKSGILRGKKILITAGATSEKIDSVRCISNLSSGKFGAAIAQAAHQMGAKVLLARSGVSAKEFYNFSQIPFSTSEDLKLILESANDADALISAAAVSDFIPTQIAGKISRSELKDELIIKGAQNIDLLASAPQKLKIAFKLEPVYNAASVQKARTAMKDKGAALCVLNTLDEIAFGSDETSIYILDEANAHHIRASKMQAAEQICSILSQLLNKGSN